MTTIKKNSKLSKNKNYKISKNKINKVIKKSILLGNYKHKRNTNTKKWGGGSDVDITSISNAIKFGKVSNDLVNAQSNIKDQIIILLKNPNYIIYILNENEIDLSKHSKAINALTEILLTILKTTTPDITSLLKIQSQKSLNTMTFIEIFNILNYIFQLSHS